VGTKVVELTADKRKLYTDEFHDLRSSPNTIRVFKLRTMRWAFHVARIGKNTGTYRVWCKNVNERDHLEDLDVDGTRMLKCILNELYGCVDWIDLAQNRSKWRAFVKKGMNYLRSITMCGIPWLAEKKK
jgi:hypothetical protein